MSTGRSDSLTSLEQEVGVLIRRVKRVIAERARELHPELQPSSYLMLGYLREHGPVRASAVAEVFDIDKGAISRQVQHLLDLGLVDRTPDPDDGRATLISVSHDGLRRMGEVDQHRRQFLDERLHDWSDGDLASFVGELRRYNLALEQTPAAEPPEPAAPAAPAEPSAAEPVTA